MKTKFYDIDYNLHGIATETHIYYEDGTILKRETIHGIQGRHGPEKEITAEDDDFTAWTDEHRKEVKEKWAMFRADEKAARDFKVKEQEEKDNNLIALALSKGLTQEEVDGLINIGDRSVEWR